MVMTAKCQLHFYFSSEYKQKSIQKGKCPVTHTVSSCCFDSACDSQSKSHAETFFSINYLPYFASSAEKTLLLTQMHKKPEPGTCISSRKSPTIFLYNILDIFYVKT